MVTISAPIGAARRLEKQEPFYRKLVRRLANSAYSWHLSSTIRAGARNRAQGSVPPSQHVPQEGRSNPVRVVCISDTHNTCPELPDGDLLLHAGDLTQRGSFAELQAQLDWLNSQPHKYKVVIGGNHDLLLDPEFVDQHPERIVEHEGCRAEDLQWGSVLYLNNNSVTLEFNTNTLSTSRHGSKKSTLRRLKIYGSPLTQQYGTWAFQFPPIRDVWTGVIPNDADVLLTHGPPKFHLDAQEQGNKFLGEELCRVRPALVVFGHIHSGYGQECVVFDDVKRAFDGVRNRAEGGGRELLVLGWQVLCACFLRLLASFGVSSIPQKETKLINAAAVGGLLDRDHRSAIVVEV